MENSNPAQIAVTLSRDDAKELRLLDRGLRTNEPLSHDGAAIAHLIKLALARSSRVAVRITDLGYQVLRFL
jgi:hypothetical protein